MAVGLSGGADSLALVAVLCALGCDVEALVVDHQLQAGSDAVARQAAAQAEAWGAQARVLTVDVSRRGSLEAAAREARYAALLGATARDIAIAHTMDDQAETYLLGALRGTPAGMRAREGRIIRPLLGARRADTREACRELGVTPWEDPQNADQAFRRVAVRTRVLPLLEEINGQDPVPAVALAAGHAAAARAAVEEMASGVEGDVGKLKALPEAARKKAIANLLRGEGATVSVATVTAIDALVMRWRGQGPVAVGKRDGRRLEATRVNGKIVVT